MDTAGMKIMLEYYDYKMRLTQRKVREDVQIDLRRVDSKDAYAEIRIKGLRTSDIFVTNQASVVEDRSTAGSLYLWIPNYKCSVTVFGTACILATIRNYFIQPTAAAPSNENISPNTKSAASNTTPTKGKRGFGIVSRDLFGSGYTPDAKVRVPNLRMKQHSSPKPLTPELRRIDITSRARQTTFMGMLTAASKSAEIPASPAVEQFALTETQNLVIRACSTGKNVFYTGGAGTGKSTLLARLIELLVQQHGHRYVFVAATTGLAACAVGGTTVHQFAGIGSALDECADAAALKNQYDRVVTQVGSLNCPSLFTLPESSQQFFTAQSCAKATVVRRFREAKVLLVDEVSMLSPALLEVQYVSAQLFQPVP